MDPGKIPGTPGKVDLTNGQRRLSPNFVEKTKVLEFPEVGPGLPRSFLGENLESFVSFGIAFRTVLKINEIYSSVPDLDTFGGVPGSLVLPSRALWGTLTSSLMVRSTLPPFWPC